MKKLLLATLLFFTLPAFAGIQLSPIQQQVLETAEMSSVCKEKIEYYRAKIKKYESIPENKRKDIDKVKLEHFKIELQNWIGYCSNADNGVSQ